MRPILFAAAMIGAAFVLASTEAMAQFSPRAGFHGPGFFGPRFYGPRFFRPRFYGPVFFRPPFFSPAFYGPRFYGPEPAYVGHVRKKPVSPKQASTKQAAGKRVATKQAAGKRVATKQASRKPVSTRHGSAMRPAAARVSAAPGARTLIPLPSQDLLAAPPQFDCEFKTTRGQADAGTDVAMRMKLDYERECYRHAEIISRDRLRQLQAAAGEMIEGVNRSEQSAATTGVSAGRASRAVIPLPDRELLEPPPPFDCEFKSAGAAGGQPQSSPARADIALHMKLDYERECYRHAEIIVRDRLRLLQVSVGEAIKAAILGREAPVERRPQR
jgi:hypothetical protein